MLKGAIDSGRSDGRYHGDATSMASLATKFGDQRRSRPIFKEKRETNRAEGGPRAAHFGKITIGNHEMKKKAWRQSLLDATSGTARRPEPRKNEVRSDSGATESRRPRKSEKRLRGYRPAKLDRRR